MKHTKGKPMTRKQIIDRAECFEVRLHVDDPEPRAFLSYKRALIRAAKLGASVYAIHWQHGETCVANYG